jgi:rhodanese-related sulfurtransferase
MCRSGKRAEAVANILSTDFNRSNVVILEGGILAWKENVEPTLNIE